MKTNTLQDYNQLLSKSMSDYNSLRRYDGVKVLIASDAWHPQVNGVVRTYEHISEELKALGCEVLVVGPSDFSFTIPMPGYSEIRLAAFTKGKLKQIIRDFCPDHIHIATEGTIGWSTRSICKKNHISFTTSYHTHFPDYVAKRAAQITGFLHDPIRNLAKDLVKSFHEASSCVMIATPSLEDELKSWGFKTPMKRMTRGIDADIFYPEKMNLFDHLPKPVAVYVGRVAIEKNIEAFLDMEWEGSKAVVGDGPSLSSLKEQYPKVHFAGKKTGKELGDHYRSADVFVFPSKTDTFGIVLIEALACGLPIAAYNVTGPKDIVTESYLGSLNDDLAIAAKQALQCGDSEQRFRHVCENYSWESSARQFMEAFYTNSVNCAQPLK